MMMPERRRLLDRLIREICRGEAQAVDHPARIEKLIGAAPPVRALGDVAQHAVAQWARFEALARAYDLPSGRTGLGATLSTLRGFVAERVIDPERAYRTCLLDLRHGLDVVRLAREIVRAEELFGLIRWCDDWLGARRTRVARVEAHLVWFVDEAGRAIGIPPATPPVEDPAPAGTAIALPEIRHGQEDASSEHRLEMHPSRTT